MWIKFTAGADLIQIYSSLIFQGLSLISCLLKGLSSKLDREGCKSYSEIRDSNINYWSKLI